jgi:hypothetical protein
LYELGDATLSAAEQDRICEALVAEANRLRAIPNEFDFGQAADGKDLTGHA